MTYGFPGNVRELENIVRGAARRAPDGVVYVSDLAAYIEMIKDNDIGHRAELGELAAAAKEISSPDLAYPPHAGLEERVHQIKLQLVKDALTMCNNKVAQTARYLKISRPSLYKLLKEIDRETSSRYHVNIESSPDRGRRASA
jgi:DNA-binding NtrC family response regulator